MDGWMDGDGLNLSASPIPIKGKNPIGLVNYDPLPTNGAIVLAARGQQITYHDKENVTRRPD